MLNDDIKNKTERRGPEMLWLDSLNNPELINLFTDEFFDGDYKRRSAFKCGRHRVSARIALKIVRWWASFGVTIFLYQIRPDIWGIKDSGPKN